MRSIAAKFLLPVSAFLVLFTALVLFRSYRTHETHVRELMDQQAALALEFDLAIRAYVGEQIRPVLEERVGPDEFIPEAMSTSFVARSVFEKVRGKFPDYIIKFSSDNPRNPANRATPDELRMIEHFSAHPEIDRWTGTITLGGNEYVAHFSARRMKASCLRCHGEPEDAPASLVERYGATAGFHRQVGDVMALDTVAIPLGPTEAALASQTLADSAIIVAGLAALFTVVVLVFRTVVSDRLAAMKRHFERAAAQPDGATITPVHVGGHDEIGVLAGSFNKLAGKLDVAYASLERRVAERTDDLAHANTSLMREIGERRRAEDRLRHSNADLQNLNQRLRAAAEELKTLMQEVTEGHAPSVRFGNDTLLRCWEVKRCEQTDCPAFECDDNRRCWEVAGTFCKGEIQGTFAQKLGDCRECEVYRAARRDSICDLGETFNDMIATLEDRQHALEGALQTAQAATEAKSQFLANMSHEIRTPMTAILGFAGIVQCEITCCTECALHVECQKRLDAQDVVNTIQRNGEYLMQIINDLLDLSKIEAGKVEIEQVACSPCRIVGEVESLMRARAESKGLSFEVAYDGAIPAEIRSDPTRLRQILINVLGNAVKFTERGGVRLVARLNTDEERRPILEFDVVDTGVGMTKEQIEKLFRPFTQADASTTRKFGGTGLGLAISKRLGQLLGGDVRVIQSAPGAGTTIRVSIAPGPLEHVKMLDDPKAATVIQHEQTGGVENVSLDCRILLAEDGPDNQRLIVYLLQRAGAQVTVVENGQLAVDAALQARDGGAGFDLILMDMQMPVMDGYQATRLLREKGYVSPIVALTAHAMAQDRERCLQAGCSDYISKPVDRKRLIETIRNQVNAPANVQA